MSTNARKDKAVEKKSEVDVQPCSGHGGKYQQAI